MVIGAALAVFLAGQSGSALDQLQLFLSSSPAFEMKGMVSVTGQSTVPFEARWQRGEDQVYKFGKTFELRQTDEALVLIDHRDKSYQEYRGFPFPVAPDGKLFFFETLAYPWFATNFPRALKAMASPNWKSVKTGTGWTLSGVWASDMSEESVVMDLNARGVPARVVRTISGDDGEFVIEHQIASLSGIPAFETPSLNPSMGYVATSLTKFFTPSPGDQIRAHPLFAADGSSTQLKSLMGKGGMAILFSAPDCELSSRYASELARLNGDLNKRGFPLVEVSLGEAKPNRGFSGARLFHDANANLERRWAIPSTPYLLCLDPDFVVVGAWEGWWAGCGSEALKSLTEVEP